MFLIVFFYLKKISSVPKKNGDYKENNKNKSETQGAKTSTADLVYHVSHYVIYDYVSDWEGWSLRLELITRNAGSMMKILNLLLLLKYLM